VKLIQHCSVDVFCLVLTETHCNTSVTLDSHMSSVYLHSSGVTALTLPNDVHISVPLTLTLTSVVPCPVHVIALPGQHIEIVLYSFGSQFDLEPSGSKGAGSLVDNVESLETMEDFKTKPHPVEAGDSSPERRCTDSIHIVDGDVETSAGLCQTRYRRQVLYTTNSNTVYVYFSPTMTSSNSHLSTAVTSQRLHYLLKLEGTIVNYCNVAPLASTRIIIFSSNSGAVCGRIYIKVTFHGLKLFGSRFRKHLSMYDNKHQVAIQK
jgi:hypothetical protein